MKIYAVAYTSEDYYGSEFEERFHGVYLHKEDAEVKLAEIHELFDRDEVMWKYREMEVRSLAKVWLGDSGVLNRPLTLETIDAYAVVALYIKNIADLNVVDPECDHMNAAKIMANVESIKSCLNLDYRLPDWPPKVEWVAPDGDKSDYRVIELEVEV